MTGLHFETARERDDRLARERAAQPADQPQGRAAGATICMHLASGAVVVCPNPAAADRFFDNRDPSAWQIIGQPVEAPVSGVETMAGVHARMRTRRQVGAPSWDAREIARSALHELHELERADLLTDLLCDLRGPAARHALCEARARITSHLQDLITAEYDAEVAAQPGQPVAELARVR